MDEITETPEQRVARGAALLDERVPGWRANINTDRINMTDGSRCVLGQLAPMITRDAWAGYHDAALFLGLADLDEEESHGFLTLLEGSMDHDATAALAPPWIEEINRGA